MDSFNRRQFMTTLGMGIVGSQVVSLNYCFASGIKNKMPQKIPDFRIDERFFSFKTPWRKVHLDFHNSKHITHIGADFNTNEWRDRLAAGNVDSIVVFAKDMHGYFYYPSKYGPVHPGLSFDLLGEQVKSCRKLGIKVYGYYCTAWDHHLAKTRPEWNMRKADGSDYQPKEGEIPGWTALCLGNKDFVDLIADHVREFVSIYELDGAWLDMTEPIAPECYCDECVRQIITSGKDPRDRNVQRAHQNKNFLDFHRRMKELVHETRPGCHVDFNDNGIGKVSERKEFLDNIDIEALPTGGWGYFYAPAQIRYQRNFGLPVYGMTGRFVSSWADFGGLKLSQQLDVELASLVANAARCDVGDQMPPNGVLDAAVYHILGKSFGRIKKLEPWLEQAAPVTEAALMIPAIPMDRILHPYIFGFTKLMMESHLQFDLVEPEQDWEKYKLVVIPDEMMPDGKTVERLHRYIDNGGAVIISDDGGLQAETGQSWLDRYGLKQFGKSPFQPAYFVAQDYFVEDMPSYSYALYEGASQWRTQFPAESLALLGEPLFQRDAKHYTSHKQTPFDHSTEYSVLATSGNVGLIGFPVGLSYYNKGYWIYRTAFQKLVGQLLPVKLVETDAPLSAEVTLTYQRADEKTGRSERFIVHVINWSSVRKTPHHPEMHEDPVPLTQLQVKLNIPLQNLKVKTAFSGQELQHQFTDGGIKVTVPQVLIHEMVYFESCQIRFNGSDRF